ncbi:MAG TPA: hypothetical protein VIM44_08970, partial [Rariglobus sp.]
MEIPLKASASAMQLESPASAPNFGFASVARPPTPCRFTFSVHSLLKPIHAMSEELVGNALIGQSGGPT